MNIGSHVIISACGAIFLSFPCIISFTGKDKQDHLNDQVEELVFVMVCRVINCPASTVEMLRTDAISSLLNPWEMSFLKMVYFSGGGWWILA